MILNGYTVRPIAFKPEMVGAILDGRKSQTRRIVKGHVLEHIQDESVPFWAERHMRFCPYGMPGDILWVQEEHLIEFAQKGTVVNVQYKNGTLLSFHKSEVSKHTWDKLKRRKTIGKWQRGRFLPFELARLFLQVQDEKIERLQNITEDDAIAEGIQAFTKDDNLYKYGLDGWEWALMPKKPSKAFLMLWAIINGQASVEANPWVWVVKFKVLSTTGKPHFLTV